MDAAPEGVQMLVCIHFVTFGDRRFRFLNARVNLDPGERLALLIHAHQNHVLGAIFGNENWILR